MAREFFRLWSSVLQKRSSCVPGADLLARHTPQENSMIAFIAYRYVNFDALVLA